MQLYASKYIRFLYIFTFLDSLLEGLQGFSTLKQIVPFNIGLKRIISDYNQGHIIRELRTRGCFIPSWYECTCNLGQGIAKTRGPLTTIALFWRWTPWMGIDKPTSTYLPPRASHWVCTWLVENIHLTWIPHYDLGGSQPVDYTGYRFSKYVDKVSFIQFFLPPSPLPINLFTKVHVSTTQKYLWLRYFIWTSVLSMFT
jgi:hypothetical protein